MKHIHINAYMKDLVMVWQANHDIQYVLNACSCVMYICDYMKKSTSTLMAEGSKDAKELQHDTEIVFIMRQKNSYML